MRARRLFPFLLAVSLVAALASPASAAWTSSKIEDLGRDPDAAFIDNGVTKTSVVYVKDHPLPSTDGIKFATLVNGVWHREVVVANGVFYGSANPQLALDADDGTPWVSFLEIGDGSPLYFRTDEGVWTLEDTIDARVLDLKVLSDGTLGIVHKPTNGGGLSYSIYDPDADTYDTEEIDPDVAGTASLFLLEDVAKIAYSSEGQVRFAGQTQLGWDTEVVSGASTSARLPSITTKGEQPRIAYITNSGLMYAFQAATDSWSRRLLLANSTATNPVIRTSQSGPPQIAFTTGSGPYALRWAVFTTSGWKISTLFPDVGGPQLGGISLVGSPSGTPRIAYNGTVTVRWAQP